MTLLIDDTFREGGSEGPFRHWLRGFVSRPAGSGLSYCDLARPGSLKTSALARAIRQATIHSPTRAGAA